MSVGAILLTAVISSGFTAGVLLLIGAALKATLLRTIGHQFDLALERSKSELKRDEEQWKATLSAQNGRLGQSDAMIIWRGLGYLVALITLLVR